MKLRYLSKRHLLPMSCRSMDHPVGEANDAYSVASVAANRIRLGSESRKKELGGEAKQW